MLVKFEVKELKDTRWYEYASRFLFGGAITMVAGLIAKKFGPVIGGLFMAFPAIFPASASLIEKHEKEKKNKAGYAGTARGRVAAGVDSVGALLGCVGLMSFAYIAYLSLPRMHALLVLTIATLSWAGISVLLWMARKRWRKLFR